MQTTISIYYKRKPIPGVDSYTIYRPGRLYIHQTIRGSPLRHYYDQIGFQRYWYDAVSIELKKAGDIEILSLVVWIDRF